MKNDDEDSREYPKVTASRRWCKPGTSKTFLNITSELQLMKQGIINRLDGVAIAGVPPLQERI